RQVNLDRLVGLFCPSSPGRPGDKPLVGGSLGVRGTKPRPPRTGGAEANNPVQPPGPPGGFDLGGSRRGPPRKGTGPLNAKVLSPFLADLEGQPRSAATDRSNKLL